MAAIPQITINMPTGLGTYKIYRGSGSGSFPTYYAEVHFFPAIGAEVEWNFRTSIHITYNDGRNPDHSENLQSWNGFNWMVQDEKCPLAIRILGSEVSSCKSYKIDITLYGSANSLQYECHDGSSDQIDWLFRDTTVEWTSTQDPNSQVTKWTRTGNIKDRLIWVRMSGNHPYVPGSREGENANFNGSMSGPCVSALWNKAGPNPSTVNSNGPTTTYNETTFSDFWNNNGNDYSYKHNKVHLYWWRPWILVSCDFTYNARWDKAQDNDLVHYPGAISATCSPAMLTCYLDLSTYGQQGQSPLPTPQWQGHELCVNQKFPEATWFNRSSINSSRAKPIYDNSNLTSKSDHKIYCGWRNLSSEVDVYCYSPSQSKYIDFSSGDQPSHTPDPDTGASVYKYGSYSRLILSGPVGTDGWHYKYLCENSRRQYFYAYDSTAQGKYTYLSSGTDNSTTFHSGVTPYVNEQYWFYTDGYNHTIVFNYKKNGQDFTYLPMYYSSSNTLIRGVKTDLPIRDGDA